MIPLAAAGLASAATPFGPHLAIGAFLVFCRVGACFMLAPGLSSGQIPARARLFVALAVALSLVPLMIDKIPPEASGGDPIVDLKLIGVELLVGGTIGALARIFLLALETLTSGAAEMLGFSNPFGFEVDENEALPPLAALISLGAVTLIFVADLHMELIRGLAASYEVVPVGVDFNARAALREVADALEQSFRLCLRVASPFVIYALIVNLALALLNRLTPQIQVFFIATPFVVGGGLILLYLTAKPAIEVFLAGFGAWLVSG